ncbi:sel1 repeat family protein [Treponema sp. OMZ 787]|uniref:tetratricopeptide repeat protein n=1 Tax=Treponema sp. OMZ 787 TaxID=2563669 RepID=UPI0020A43419|nr:tetratricopeptide repeat protein [Treponema sp. OMZ 787]UTC62019.1 sel1 repeat family protein [Treponema sp. OMZ 787]
MKIPFGVLFCYLALTKKRVSLVEGKALFKLGEISEYGRGETPKDEKKALQFYIASAQKGYTDAETAIGRFYEEGKGGLQKNEKEALKWYKKAARKGNKSAQEKLNEKN